MIRSDNLTPEQRRKTMQSVKSSNSKMEQRLRKALWGRGLRYRKNYARVFGKPDVVFPSLNIAIFCDSEFWHGHDWESRKKTIKSNQKYWFEKIERNMARDRKVTESLQKEGWTVLRFWETEITKNLDGCVEVIERAVKERKILAKGRKAHEQKG